ncbi:MAG: hypothetical protein DMG92_02025 [Acidobacteria bacterium]|nr:MAG: hypothetical protein DMG92_02025 [Acidobacteriota bacterium]
MPIRPPGPKPRFFIGNMPLASPHPLSIFSAWAREFGDIFYYRAAWLHVYFLNHPDLIEEVLVRNYKNFLKDRVVRNSRWFFGQGLLTNEGDSWLRQRRLSAPAFHRERVASYAKIMTDRAVEMLAAWRNGETRDIHQEMMRLTLGIVVRALFNVESDETTALSMTWTWHLLSQHPEVEQKLHDELDRVLSDRVPQFSDLPALPFTERVIKESMRLYPPAWSLARTVISDFELRGYRIPAGANVVMSHWIMHRHPTYFPDPEKFDPDRWLLDRSQKLPRFAYFPFGGGPRQCIGSSFAMMEATLLLATIAQRFRLRSVPDHPVVLVPSFTLRPKYGLRMTLESRASVTESTRTGLQTQAIGH